MNSRRFIRPLTFFGMSLAPLTDVQALTVAQTGTPVSGAVRNSIAIVEGRPALVWSDRTLLKYSRALDANGTAWDEPLTLNVGPGLGVYATLRIVNGKPAASIFDNSRGLVFIRAADSLGGVWDPPVIVSSGVTMQTNMEVVDGHPAVAFRDSGAGVIFKRATDPDGTAWGPRVTAATFPGAVFHSMKVVNGRPAVAVADSSGLWFARAEDSAGTVWLSHVHAAPDTGVVHCSMNVIDGHPAISYTVAGDVLKYVRATDPEGTAWSEPVTPDPVDLTGVQSALAMINGKPAIAYHSGAPLNDLRYVQAGDSHGAIPGGWKRPLTLASEDITGEYPTLMEVNGWPAVTSFDVTQSSLKYLRATNPGEDAIWELRLLLMQNGNPVASGGTVECGPLEPGGVGNTVLVIRNQSLTGSAINILGLTIDGPDAAEFSIAASPATPIAGGGQAAFTVRYAPVSLGKKMAVLHLTTDAGSPAASYDIILTGDSAPDIAVEWPQGTSLEDGASLIFPIAAPDTGSDLIFPVRNRGGASMNGLTVNIDGPDKSEYALAAVPASVVPPGGSTSFTLRHTPLTDGGKIVSLHIASNVTGSRNPFDLTIKRIAGKLDDSFHPFQTEDLTCVAVQAGGQILAGGFETLTAFNPDGSADNTFFSPAITDGDVICIALQKDGKILIGGDFDRVEGKVRPGMARLLPDGSLDPSFVPALEAGASCMAVQPDGKIVAGLVPNPSAAIQPWLVRLHPDGSRDETFSPRLNFAVYCVALQADGRILIGGPFDTVNDLMTGGIARLLPDGTIDPSFSRTQPLGVLSLALQPDGKIFAGGNFQGSIARLSVEGIRDPSMVLSCDDTVHAVELQIDGKCLVAGNFTAVGGLARHRIARINADGTLDETYTPSANGGPIRRMAMQADGGVLLQGDFTAIGGVGVPGFARLENEPARAVIERTAKSSVRWLRRGAGPEVRDVSFEIRPERSGTWTLLGTGTRIAGGWELTGVALPSFGAIRARGLAGDSLIETVTPILTPLESWRMRYFATAADTGSAADEADPDLDGLTNFVEFAFDLSPVNVGSRTLPEFRRSGEMLTASFIAPADRGEVRYSAEWSPSMEPGTWTEIPDTGTSGEHVFSVPASAERKFVRFVIRTALSGK